MSNKIKKEMDKIEIPNELGARSKIGVSKASLEMSNSKRSWSFIIIPALVVAIALVIIAPNIITNNTPENPIIKTINSNTVIDIYNPRAVVGFSDNVFIGKVIKQVGTRNLTHYPETQFEVEVLNNIKGEVKGSIKVNQAGGYVGNELFLMEGDKQLIEGKTYLFATRYLAEENWHTLIPVVGDIQFNNEVERNKLFKKYTEAYEEEIPFKF